MAGRRDGLKGIIRGDEGVAALEYAILVGVIAAAVALALTTFGDDITAALQTIGDEVAGIEAPAIEL